MSSTVRCKVIIAIFIVIICSSCVTYNSIELPPEELRQQLNSGEILHSGEQAYISTADGSRYAVSVVTITESSVIGEYLPPDRDSKTVDCVESNQSCFEDDQDNLNQESLDSDTEVVLEKVEIPISDIVAIETPEVHVLVKAAVLTGAFAAGWLMFALPALIIGAIAI
jgi:hypothetical protein